MASYDTIIFKLQLIKSYICRITYEAKTMKTIQFNLELGVDFVLPLSQQKLQEHKSWRTYSKLTSLQVTSNIKDQSFDVVLSRFQASGYMILPQVLLARAGWRKVLHQSFSYCELAPRSDKAQVLLCWIVVHLCGLEHWSVAVRKNIIEFEMIIWSNLQCAEGILFSVARTWAMCKYSPLCSKPVLCLWFTTFPVKTSLWVLWWNI